MKLRREVKVNFEFTGVGTFTNSAPIGFKDLWQINERYKGLTPHSCIYKNNIPYHTAL
jgi:hypothetical protein